MKIHHSIRFRSISKRERNQWLETVISKFSYFRCRKKDKSILKKYLSQMTGLSDAQLTRLIGRKKRFGKIWSESTKRHHFPRKYTPADIARLIETDNLHYRLSGPATKKILEREFKVFGKRGFRTPYEALRRLPRAQECLKDGLTFEKLDIIAKKQSDNESAAVLQKAKEELFNNFKGHKLYPSPFVCQKKK